MGILRKAVIGSLIVGAGAIALVKNKKTVVKMGKKAVKSAEKIVYEGNKKISRLVASRRSKQK